MRCDASCAKCLPEFRLPVPKRPAATERPGNALYYAMSFVSIPEMFLRILMAFVAGFVVGWERESHGRPAGLRTTILACVASAVAMIVSEVLFAESAAAT